MPSSPPSFYPGKAARPGKKKGEREREGEGTEKLREIKKEQETAVTSTVERQREARGTRADNDGKRESCARGGARERE